MFIRYAVMAILVCCLVDYPLNAQTTFASPGQETCNSTTYLLAMRTAADGVAIQPYLWLDNSCLDANLQTLSCNSPVVVGGVTICGRNPTFCYNNGYFASTTGYPLAIARNSTANSGNCAYSRSNVVANFSVSAIRPIGLTFTIADVDNPYDSILVKVYSGGALVNYTFSFAEPDPAKSFAWTTSGSTSGTAVSFNGGANGVWGESSGWNYNVLSPTDAMDKDWAKGAINFAVDPNFYIDSVVMTSIIRNTRNDINAGESIGNFKWITTQSLSVSFGKVEAKILNNQLMVLWESLKENNNDRFEVELSHDGINWDKIGEVKSLAALGNSDQIINYSFKKEQDGTMLLFGGSVFLIGLWVLIFKRRNIFLYTSILLMGLGIFGISCGKQNTEGLQEASKKILIRIAQVDKDGSKAYSKVVQAVRE